MESVREVKRKCKRKESRYGKRYCFELKLRCVKLRLEEGLPVSLLSKEVGGSKDVIYRWVKAYQERGEAGLRNQVRSLGSQRKLPGAVRKKIQRSLSTYKDRPKWKKLIERCMREDFSWEQSARENLKLYEKAVRKEGRG